MNYSTGHRTGHMKTLNPEPECPVAGSSRGWRQEGRAPDGPLQEDRPGDRNRHATSPGRPAERRRHPNLLATIDVVRDTPGLARFRFIARNRWIAGTHSQNDDPRLHPSARGRDVTGVEGHGGRIGDARPGWCTTLSSRSQHAGRTSDPERHGHRTTAAHSCLKAVVFARRNALSDVSRSAGNGAAVASRRIRGALR